MRGRLIFKFLAQVHRLDTLATDTVDPDGPGPLKGGYDPDFKESILIDNDGNGVGERVRREHPSVSIPCQMEPETFDTMKMFASGNAPRSEIDLVFHFKDLERLQLVDTGTKDALIRPGDRLGAIYDKQGSLVQKVKTPPGLYVTEARPIGFGLNKARPGRNLLLVSFSDREQAARRIS